MPKNENYIIYTRYMAIGNIELFFYHYFVVD